MGKEGEHQEFNMTSQDPPKYHQPGEGRELAGMGARNFEADRNLNKLLHSKMKYIVKLQAFWRGHTARRLISLLRAKQLGSSKYFTQEEARETISKRLYDPDQPREQRPPY